MSARYGTPERLRRAEVLRAETADLAHAMAQLAYRTGRLEERARLRGATVRRTP